MTPPDCKRGSGDAHLDRPILILKEMLVRN
jgi:hypothetical protein